MAAREKDSAAPEVLSKRRSLLAPELRPQEAPIVDHDASAPEVVYPHGYSSPPFQHSSAKEQEYGGVGGQTAKSRKICGLRPVTFWLAVALVVVVVGAAVGGGVGGSLAGGSDSKVQTTSTTSSTASSHTAAPTTRESSSATSPTSASESHTSTATSYATSGSTGIAALSCTDDDIYTTPFGARFEEHCFVNWPAGMNGVQGQVEDLDNLIRYSFQACMNACEAYNSQGGGQECQAVTYDQNLTSSVSHNGGNCVLKSTNGATNPAYDYIASAVRLQ